MVVAGHAENVHDSLPLGPSQVMGLISVIQPARWGMLNSQRIQKQACDKADRKDDNAVENGQQDSRLKISYRVS
jgi:hypothetical protein